MMPPSPWINVGVSFCPISTLWSYIPTLILGGGGRGGGGEGGIGIFQNTFDHGCSFIFLERSNKYLIISHASSFSSFSSSSTFLGKNETSVHNFQYKLCAISSTVSLYQLCNLSKCNQLMVGHIFWHSEESRYANGRWVIYCLHTVVNVE